MAIKGKSTPKASNSPSKIKYDPFTPFYSIKSKQTVWRKEPDKVYDMPRKAKRK